MARRSSGRRGRPPVKKPTPEQQQLIDAVEAVLGEIGVELVQEEVMAGAVRSRGGLVRVKGRPVLLVDKRVAPDDRIDIYLDALGRLHKEGRLLDVTLDPELQRALDGLGAVGRSASEEAS